jgi:hypothetical protein
MNMSSGHKNKCENAFVLDTQILGAGKWTKHNKTRTERADNQLNVLSKEIDVLKAAQDEHAIVDLNDPRGKIAFLNAVSRDFKFFPRRIAGQPESRKSFHTHVTYSLLWMIL